MSGQWMAEGSDVLAPLALLTKLRSLRITRLRDGAAKDLKHIENLHHLERLFFEGSNYYWQEDSSENSASSPPESTLDLTNLKQLKSAIFVECRFRAKSEGCTKQSEDFPGAPGVQALVLPEQLEDVTCIHQVYGGDWSQKLLDELRGRGIKVCEKVAPRDQGLEEFWSEVDKNGWWFHIQ